MMHYITETFIPAYAQLAGIICLVGMLYMFIKYGWNRLVMPREKRQRTRTILDPKPYSIWRGLRVINVETWTKVWFRANPVTAMGHVFYHVGFFSAMGIYGLVTVLHFAELSTMSFSEGLLRVADWFAFRAEIFGSVGAMALLGDVLYAWFGLALVLAVTGMSIPFIMTFRGQRGMVRPVDEVCGHCNVYGTDGLKTRNSLVGIQRKVIGLMALFMDAAMLVTFLVPVGAEFSYMVHAIFGATIVAVLPFSFLFHEVWRLRMWDASVLYSRRITAA